MIRFLLLLFVCICSSVLAHHIDGFGLKELRKLRKQFIGNLPGFPPLGPGFGPDFGPEPGRRRHGGGHRRHHHHHHHRHRHPPGPDGFYPDGPGFDQGPPRHGPGPHGPGPHGPGPHGPGRHGPPGHGPNGPNGPNGFGQNIGPGPGFQQQSAEYPQNQNGGNQGPPQELTFSDTKPGNPDQTNFDAPKPHKPKPSPVGQFQSSCGVSTTSRIVGGEEVQKDDYSWAAALFRPSKDGFEHFCGATIISNVHLLTACHCVVGMKPENLLVRVGLVDLANGNPNTDLRVKEILRHPKYNSTTYNNDIAILKLQTPITFTPQLQPCCLPESSDELSGRAATVVGWGSTMFGGPSTTVLQQVELPVWSNEECQQKISVPVNERMICAGLKDQSGHDACQGDSGGPLLVQTSANRWGLAGIVSYGFKCAQKGVPGVYTRVSKYNNWILKTAT